MPLFVTKEALKHVVRDILQHAYELGELGYPAKDFKLEHVRDAFWKVTCPEGKEFIVNTLDRSISEDKMRTIARVAKQLIARGEIDLAREVLSILKMAPKGPPGRWKLEREIFIRKHIGSKLYSLAEDVVKELGSAGYEWEDIAKELVQVFANPITEKLSYLLDKR